MRVSSYGLTPEGKLHIAIGGTDFKHYAGSRDVASLRRYGYAGIANPLSTDVAIITADNKLVLGKKTNGDAAGSLVTFGGYSHPEKDIVDGKFDIFRTAEREIEEELGITQDEIAQEECFGLTYQYINMCSVVAMIGMRLTLTADEVKQHKGKEKEGELIFVDLDERSKPVDVIEDAAEQKELRAIMPDVRVTIALARRWVGGEGTKGLPEPHILHTPERLKTAIFRDREPQGTIRYVGFDMDGTLLNTMEGNTRMFADYILERYGIDPDEASEHYRETVGRSTGNQLQPLLEKHGIQLSEEEAAQIGLEIDTKTESEVTPEAFDQVLEKLQELRRKGYYIFVSSGDQQENIKSKLQKAGLLQYVDAYAGATPDDPDFVKGAAHFKKIAEDLGIDYKTFIAQAVFIGDGLPDANAAKGAGMRFIGKIGTNSEEEFKQAGVQTSIIDFSSLSDLLLNLPTPGMDSFF